MPLVVPSNIKSIAMKNNYSYFFLISLVLALVSCGQESSTPKGVSLTPISFAAWDKQLAQYQGDIVVADLWATWCQPCIKRFPKMVELNKQYADRAVTFVSINFDDTGDGESLQKAESYLKEVNAEFDNFYFKENLIDAFEHMGVIALPVVVIYGKDGKEAARLTNIDPNNQFTEADIENTINRLLAAN